MGRFRRRAAAVFSLLLMLAALGTGVGAPTARAEAPVDVRGRWSGVAVVDIGTFPNTLNFQVEDFATGAVSGDANGGTYTLDGTVTGHQITFASGEKASSYMATSKLTISPDGSTMDGTFSDSNGRTGTEHFTRDTPAPSGTPVLPSQPPAVTPAPAPGPTAAPGSACSFSGVGALPGAIVAPGVDPAVVRVVGDASHPVVAPAFVAIDTGDPRGRVFVASAGQTQSLTVIAGRPLDAARIDIERTVPAAVVAGGIAVDSGTGRVYVTDAATCRLLVLDGRAAAPSVVTTLNLTASPDAVAVEPTTGRILLAFPATGHLLILNPDLSTAADLSLPALSLPAGPVQLALDPVHQVAYAGAGGQVTAIKMADSSPSILATTAIPAPAALAVDPAGFVFTIDTARSELVSWRVTASWTLTLIGATPLSLPPAAGSAIVSSRVGMVFSPTTREILVAAGAAASGAFFSEQDDGRTVLARTVAGLAGGVAAVLDPSTGRVFVAQEGPGRIAVLAAGGAAAPSLAFELPGPLEISLAPADVARSLGIMTIVMLLLGAPTPIFNSTLSANRVLIERYARRRVPRRLRRAASSGVMATFGRRIVALSTTWTGFALYLVLITLLYACLDPRFPFEGAPRTLFTTVVSIAFGTAVSQIPGEVYVRRRYGEGGKVRLVLWTLGLAAGCVVITRVTGVQPGYVYGIIGGFTFKAALTKDDNGRMTWRGMVILLGAGFGAWFLRIPFQPGTGLVGGDGGAIINQLLAGIFIGAIESSAIGLIPLRFLSGETLYHWNRRRWALLWGLGLLLFAHVILYPVSSFEPDPSATGLWTVLASVAAYGGLAMGFWWFFHRRSLRHEARVRRSAAAGRTIGT